MTLPTTPLYKEGNGTSGAENGPETGIIAAGSGNSTDHSLAWYEGLADEARRHIESSKSENTRRAQRSDWADFTDWCKYHQAVSLPAPPETVALYLTDCARSLKTSTIKRRMSSISEAH